jgi:HlyD family secretion protein
MRKILSRMVVLVIMVALLGGGGYWYWQAQLTSKTSFRFVEIKKGRLVATVGATGTLQPRETVDVGAQVPGRIVYIGDDPNTQSKIVDWGSAVEGPVIYQLVNSIKLASWAANTATITLHTAGGGLNPFKSGQEVVITGINPAAYNGTFTIRTANSTGFSFDLPLAADPGAGTVAVPSGVGADDNNNKRGNILNNGAVFTPVASWAADIATITLAANITSNNSASGRLNPFVAGDTVEITGLTPAAYNGRFIVLTANSTGFTIDLPLVADPGAGTVDKTCKILKIGTVLAQIDPDLYDAALISAKASLKAALADTAAKTATLAQATADWERAQGLYNAVPKGVAKAEFDQFKAAYELALANLDLSKANIGVQQANLKTAQTNLNYATISSPVNGVVIDRRVNNGQTVVASLSAPSLFLIAKDLTRMEIWATVNEVDVGRIIAGQKVKFTVDAIPNKTFHGKVVPQGKLPYRLNATMNQNVVTYTVVVSADNSELKFKPYWTTNIAFIVDDIKDALLVPNAALRWQPSKQQIAPDIRDTYFALRGKKPSTAEAEEAQSQGFVWIQDEDGHLRYSQLKIGLSDSVNTQILGVLSGAELKEDSRVIVAEGKADSANTGANPFVSSPFGGSKKKE